MAMSEMHSEIVGAGTARGMPFLKVLHGAGVERAAEEASVEVKVVRSSDLLEELMRARRSTYAGRGLEMNDQPVDAQRRFATTLGLFVDGRLVGAFSAHRLSEALCTLGYLLAGVGIERYRPDKVVEVGSMFVLPEYSGHGYVRSLLEAGRVLVAGMKPDLLVGFAVRAVIDRYLRHYGFRSVGPFVPHPLAPQVEVMPIVATFEEFARAHFA
jgi:GNAT superfamily N-acetyltransferase